MKNATRNLLLTGLVVALGLLPGRAPGQIDPITGNYPGAGVPVFDPATGQMISQQPLSDWKDAGWEDPKIVLTNVVYENLTLHDIAKDLRVRFREQFDILLPSGSPGPNALNPNTLAPMIDEPWDGALINLQLKNVTASELFNAMNLIFQNDRTPLRWELKVIGNRQIALLRVLSLSFVTSKRIEPLRRVFFVGDLIGDEKRGGMTIDRVVEILREVWQTTETTGGQIQFHKEAQLVIVSGSGGQVDFVAQTLAALQAKVRLEQERQHTTTRSGGQTNSGAGGGSR